MSSVGIQTYYFIIVIIQLFINALNLKVLEKMETHYQQSILVQGQSRQTYHDFDSFLFGISYKSKLLPKVQIYNCILFLC
jgi:hypothetical protein